MSTQYSEADLATLTPEERAVILDDDGAAEQNAKVLAAIANGGDDEEDDDTVVEDAAPIEGKADAVVEDKPAVVEPDEKQERFRPQYQAEVPADFAARIDEIKAKTDEIAAKFKAGDMEFDEFQTQTRAIDAERTELVKAQTKAEIAAEMTQQTAQQEWAFLVKSFVKATAKSGGTDYVKDEAKRNDLDGFIKVLATNPANNDKDPEWFLEEAHKRVNALYGTAAPAVAKEPVKTSRKPNLENLPKTLSGVPGSDGPGDLQDEFAAIDALSGDKLEAAIAKMTPAQREKFMSQA